MVLASWSLGGMCVPLYEFIASADGICRRRDRTFTSSLPLVLPLSIMPTRSERGVKAQRHTSRRTTRLS
jgi:hypothetical protein